MRKQKDAIEDFTNSINLNPTSAWAYAQRGWCKFYYSTKEECMQDLNIAIEMDADFSWAYAKRGRCYYAMGKYNKALQDFDKLFQSQSNRLS